MIHVNEVAVVVIAASMPARSAEICAAVDPVLVIAVAPFVIAAGHKFADSVTVFVRNCPSRNAATPAITVSRTVRSASGSPIFSSSSDNTTILAAL
jgi:hypothetical protein